MQYQRGVLNPVGGNGGGSIVTPIALPNTFTQRSYLLDSLGNWRNTAFTPEGGSPQTETRQHNGLNEITRISNPTISELANPSYDLNGNLTNDGTFSYVWDALNRLIAVNSGEEAVSGYYYDALNRRIRKTVGSTNTDFIYSGWRCFEDRNPNGGEESSTDTPIIQYLWGIYLDEVLQITTLVPITTGSGETAKTYDAGTYYPLQDLLYRTTATVTITDESAAIQEAYDFDAYGRTLIFNVAGTDDNWWADNARQVSNSLCQFLFTGQRFDSETGLYYFKRRYYSPALGRFLSRDPIGLTKDDSNLLSYVAENPARRTDPTGLASCLSARQNYEQVVNNPLSTEKQIQAAYSSFAAACGNSQGAAATITSCFDSAKAPRTAQIATKYTIAATRPSYTDRIRLLLRAIPEGDMQRTERQKSASAVAR